MVPNIQPLLDLVFRDPSSGVEFGPIRKSHAIAMPRPDLRVLAEDSCGNRFAISKDGAVHFWDHETDDLSRLAESFEEFARKCTAPTPVDLETAKRAKVWLDPAFAAEHGIEVDEDGRPRPNRK